MKIILASASPRRRMLLEQIGITPEVVPSGIEERISGAEPEKMVIELSSRKAKDIAERYAEAKEEIIVIGADTVVAADGHILGKPADGQEAGEMIRLLEGRSHQVYTGVTLIRTGRGRDKKIRSFAEKTEVEVYPMADEEIRTYAGSKEPLDKAGAYGIQGSFAAYIKGIRGDYTNVVGLPVGRTYQELKKLRQEEENHD